MILTLGHFLTNCAISSFPEPYTASDSLSNHSRRKLIQSLRNKFWNRWSTEYLIHLQTRAKWSVQNMTENQLSFEGFTGSWTGLGRNCRSISGSDGLGRVDLMRKKTPSVFSKRAITKGSCCLFR
ncbi:integrase catalytic domain-containing protein [Trichonephila inaurata madagascariensis]|uniref:Integrase catalytic domain-containing protein n=1 Tax=Trichonephila inaurata madagascariensis TaxID=2747483 RepID=A0A8X6MDD4_9ARAC|nr:integrase catalytic domain-containing protein [Trichonephila inaurata madagascariensis]